MRRIAAVSLLIVLATVQFAWGEMPRTMSYQGVLKDENGNLVADGDYDITFRIYDSPTEPGELWEETQTLAVADGIFNAILGGQTDLDLDFDVPYWLGIAIGEDPELTPRIELAASPYAYRAAVADSALSSTGVADNDWVVVGNNMYSAVPGYIGIGTETPTQHLDIVAGTLSLRASDSLPQWMQIVNSPAHGGIFNSRVSESNKRPLSIGAVHDGSGSPSGELYMRFSVGSIHDPIRAMTIQESGNIGIGTTGPVRQVEIYNPEKARLRLTSGEYLKDSNIELKGVLAGGDYPSLGSIQFLDENDDVHAHIRFGGIGPPGSPLGLSFCAGGGSADNCMRLTQEGRLGVGTLHPEARLDVAGMVKCQALAIVGGADLAEPFDVRGDIRLGMVVSIDPENAGRLKVSERAYDRCVAGVVSGAGGIDAGLLMGKQSSPADGEHPVALSGRVYCLADASQGPIEPGDLLTTSDNPGHAMKATDPDRSHGAVIGKAMTPLAEGQGLILVLVNLQ